MEMAGSFLRTKAEKDICWGLALKDISAGCVFIDRQPQQEQMQNGEQVSE
jgi:hypothetical protein